MHDLIKILFIGSKWTNSYLYYVEKDANGEIICKTDIQYSGHTVHTSPDTIIGIENRCGLSGLREIENLVSQFNWQKIAGAYVITNKIDEAKKILSLISKDNLYNKELYGLDPDYFQTMIPIASSNKKIIENYLLDLKLDQSMKGRIKLLIKKIFVTINFSEKLYEKFIIVLSPKKRSDLC